MRIWMPTTALEGTTQELLSPINTDNHDKYMQYASICGQNSMILALTPCSILSYLISSMKLLNPGFDTFVEWLTCCGGQYVVVQMSVLSAPKHVLLGASFDNQKTTTTTWTSFGAKTPTSSTQQWFFSQREVNFPSRMKCSTMWWKKSKKTHLLMTPSDVLKFVVQWFLSPTPVYNNVLQEAYQASD